ncbi:MAG TPA: TonB family protein [Methylocella sp.]|nr:TonB family protein [Methylocella sp.]
MSALGAPNEPEVREPESGEATKTPEEPQPLHALRPAWLRPVVSACVIGVHVAALGGFLWLAANQITPLDEIKVEIVPQGESVTETSTVPTPEASRVVTQDQPIFASPELTERDDPLDTMPSQHLAQPQPTPDLALPEPKVESPDTPPVAIEHPKPRKIDKNALPTDDRSEEIKKAKVEAARQRAAKRALKKAKAEAHARRLAEHAQIGAPAIRAGVKEGSGFAKRMSNAAYAALVSAEINRHKHYPSSAREHGAGGSVGVVFSIGPSGTIISHSIVHSSGNSAIDAAVHEMLAASHPPPPPGGSFRGSVTISFNLTQ